MERSRNPLRLRRMQFGWSQSDLVREVMKKHGEYVHIQTIKDIESGRTSRPQKKTQLLLASTLQEEREKIFR